MHLHRQRGIKPMNTTTSNDQDQHQQIQLLLPWYINQSLQAHDRLMVDKHIRHCLLCRRELVSLRKLANAVIKSSDLDVAAETSFASLTGKLQSRLTIPVVSRSARQPPLSHRLSCYVKHNGFRYAMAASLLLALLPIGWRIMPVPTDGAYYTLSAAQPAASQATELRVVFAKSASDTDITNLLTALQAERVGEANSVGAFTVRLNTQDGKPNLEQSLAMLRSRQDVLLAEPVLQP